MMSKYIQVGNSNGEFQIQLNSYIGGGTYGSIYNCLQVSFGPNVQAIRKELCAKILRVEKQNKDKNKLQQEREHQINKILKENENNKNQNIVQVFYVNLNQQKSELITVMEKCQMNLQQYWLQNPQKRKYDQFSIFNFVRQFINGYKILYKNQIVHRNIKPNNILVNIENNGFICYKIGDFGLGKIYKNNEFITTTLVMSGYSAPEILGIDFELSKSFSDLAKEKKHVVDMFSLGMILYQLATGSLPFKVSEERAFFEKLKTQPIKIQNTMLNQQLNNLIEQMLIYNPQQRLSFDQLISQSIINFQNKTTQFPFRFAQISQQPNQQQTFQNSQIQNQSQIRAQLNEDVKKYLNHYLKFNHKTIKEEVQQVLNNINQRNFLNSDDLIKIYEWFQYDKGYQNSYSESELQYFYKLKCLRYNQEYQSGLQKFQLILKLNNQS